ncbi:2-nitropropane dioxygenase [Arthrobacter sp. AFG20]|uniref:2-nitropropane dioxygenase n=1 Tax=Arthrobacter sp. AFG20 TaxID=1688671 RepID=UPI000C9DE987|nr:2-nitropropane dioxygenase [Arthrobacter sp. AFG20]PNH80860.1 2-nitropropane dioxygenase [Arthrobacter sp. AFG20]
MSALSVNQSVPGYRRASVLEVVAVRIGAGLVEWAERRRLVPEETVRLQRDAARRRDELSLLRGDLLGAAHSGLLLSRR